MAHKIYVGNLPWRIRDQDLADLFAQIGTVVSAQVIVDRHSQRSKGFGFVEFDSPEAVQKAISEFDGQEVDDRPLKVSEAREPQKRED